MNKSIFNKLGLAAACVPLLMAGQTASAATATTTFNVTATVTAACTVSATNLAFTPYDPTSGTDLDGTNSLTVNCTNGTTYDMGLDLGANDTGTQRRMTDSTDFLNYGLFQNSARTTSWGDTVGTDTVASTGTGVDQNFTVYGQIPASQNVPASSYSDTINVTVTF